jgi:hypothetical protein
LPLRPTRRQIMFRSRRQVAAAACFSVLLAGAATGISVVPGATAAETPAFGAGLESGNLSHRMVSSGLGVQRKRPRRVYVKTLNSRNARPIGLSDESNNCTLTHSGLGDMFTLESDSTRCTWTNSSFSHMGRHEIFVVKLRFDNRPPQHVEWENEISLRPSGDFGNEDCASGGNHEVMLLRLFVDRRHSRDVWRLDIRGGRSLNLSDQVVKRLKLGPIVVGKTLTLKFDIIAHYLHGAASVWQNGKVIYANRDRPLGFHYDCDRRTDISNFPLRMQHGVYREGGGPTTLTSSGFRFLLTKRVR